MDTHWGDANGRGGGGERVRALWRWSRRRSPVRNAAGRARASLRRIDGAALGARARGRAALARRAARALGGSGTRSAFPGRARGVWRLAARDVRGCGASRKFHRPVPARPPTGAGSAAHDPGRERHRPRADDVRRHACRRACRAGVDGLRAAEPGLRQAALHLRSRRARLDLCRRGRPLRQGAGQDRRHAPRDRGQPRQPRRRQGHALLHPDGGEADARGRCGVRARGAGHGGQDPLHLGLDRPAQGRDQHPAHDVRQPGERRGGVGVSSPTTRPSSSTGCRGTTPSAATTTST